MIRLHRLSGILLTVFIAPHLFNHLYSLASAGQHIAIMQYLRIIYRFPPVEAILMMAVLVQIVSGFGLFRKMRQLGNRDFFENLQLWSGFYMALFLLIHVSAVLAGRFLMHLDTNFYFGVAGLNTFPLNLFFIPYYALAILSFFGHIAAIHYRKMTKPLLALSVKHQSYLILLLGLLTCIFCLYGLTGKFEGIVVPNEYQLIK